MPITIAESFVQLRGFDENLSIASSLLRSGDAIILEREPWNRYDSNAVTAKTSQGVLIGRVSRELAESYSDIIARCDELRIHHRAFLLGLSTETRTRGNGATYESTLVELRVEFVVAPPSSDRQIRGLDEVFSEGVAEVTHIVE